MLSEEYRPTTFADYVGQSAIVGKLREAVDRNVKKQTPIVLWISGESGTGKTTLAGIVARYVGCAEIGITELEGGHVGASDVTAIRDNLHLSPMQGEWKALVVDEAHLITKNAVGKFLTLLEKQLCRRRLVVFTSTRSLDDGLFGDENAPFKRRCLCVKLSPVNGDDAVERLLDIAGKESIELDSQRAALLLKATGGNFGEAIARLEMGDIPDPASQSKPRVSADVAATLARLGIAS